MGRRHPAHGMGAIGGLVRITGRFERHAARHGVDRPRQDTHSILASKNDFAGNGPLRDQEIALDH